MKLKPNFDGTLLVALSTVAVAAIVGSLITIAASGCTGAQIEQGLGVASRLMRTVADVIDPVNESLVTNCEQGTMLAKQLGISSETTAELTIVCAQAKVRIGVINSASKELRTAIDNNDIGAAAVASERLSNAMKDAGKTGSAAYQVMERARKEMEEKVTRD